MLDGQLWLAASGLAGLLGGIGPWALVVFGIGMVIFVHELGHFWAAKLCGVRAEVFSLGFGPRLWGFKRGETEYRVSLVPLGGYVKMAGETRGEELQGEPYELMSKSVGQRLLIFVAGVTMNMVFAILVFPFVFSVGVPFIKPEIGTVQEWVNVGTEDETEIVAGPGWLAGLKPGDAVERIGGSEIFDYTNILTEVALGDADGMTFWVKRSAGEDPLAQGTGAAGDDPAGSRAAMPVRVVPHYSEAEGRNFIGVSARLDSKVKVLADGPAAGAGMKDDDVVVQVDGQPVHDSQEMTSALAWKDQVTLTVHRGDQELAFEVEGKPVESGREVGVGAVVNYVAGVRGTWLDARWQGLSLRHGDRILAVGATAEATTSPAVFTAEDWCAALDEVARSGAPTIFVAVQRDGHRQLLEFPAERHAALTDDVALGPDFDSAWVVCSTGSPAERSGLPRHALLVEVDGHEVHDWSEVRQAIQDRSSDSIELAYRSPDEVRRVKVTPASRIHDFGLAYTRPEVTRQFGLLGACGAGWRCSLYWTKSTYLTVKKMVSGQVSPRNLGGILSIGYVSRTYANSGVAKLLFFLAILSINLAFINLLPIPILDGGHVLFLLIEKVKGSPVSDRVMNAAQVVGLVLILALLFYVTYNDILRLFSTR